MRLNRFQKKALEERYYKFCAKFADEIDIAPYGFSEWIRSKHAELIGKLSNPIKKTCELLRSEGVFFKLKFPIFDAAGHFKFSDIYIPGCNLAILIGRRNAEQTLFSDDKAEWFRNAGCEVEFFDYDDAMTGEDIVALVNSVA